MEKPSPDYILDIAGLGDAAGPPAGDAGLRGRPWLAVKWRCCSVYSRVYRNRRGDAYEGRCPRCATPVRASIGEGGTSSRFFEAG
ncbi:MAG: hypothetical protein AAGL98_11370 [Planctomycetota bacterium]